MRTSVYYAVHDESGALYPEWLLLTGIENVDWGRTLFLRLDAPFERYGIDELEEEAMSLSVPDFVYVRHPSEQTLLGIHLPSLEEYVDRLSSVSGTPFSHMDLTRLLLRFADIEETLQTEVRSRFR